MLTKHFVLLTQTIDDYFDFAWRSKRNFEMFAHWTELSTNAINKATALADGWDWTATHIESCHGLPWLQWFERITAFDPESLRWPYENFWRF